MPVVKLDVFAVIFDQRFGRSRVENGKMNDKWSRVRQSYSRNGKMYERVCLLRRGELLFHQLGILWNCGIVRLQHCLDDLNMQQG